MPTFDTTSNTKFSLKQEATLRKAIRERYLTHALPDDVISWLARMEPKTTEDANLIIENVLLIAYEIGLDKHLGDKYYDHSKRKTLRDMKAHELIKLMDEYTRNPKSHNQP